LGFPERLYTIFTHTHQALYIIQYSIDGSTFFCQSGVDGLTHHPLLINNCLFLGNCGGFLEVLSTLLRVGDNLNLCVGVVYGGDAHWLMFASGFKRR